MIFSKSALEETDILEDSNIKFSVIVPIYNAEKYLQLCLDSIINQNYKNIEIILIDDGSTDSSFEICEEYERRDNRIILIKQNNKGIVYSRKVGIAIASGNYISFVDADDSIELDLFSSIITQLEGRYPDVIAFGLKEVYIDHICEKDNKYKYGYYERKDIISDILPTMICHGCFFEFGILPNLVCKIINRKFLEKINLYVSNIVTVGEDADFSFQIISQANSLQLLNLFPYNYYQHGDTMMIKPIAEKQLVSLKNDLDKAFLNHEQYNTLIGQVDKYYKFVMALKRPDKIEIISSFFEKNKYKRCALYGAGGFGKVIYLLFRSTISIWADKNNVYYEFRGLNVISIDALLKLKEMYDYIFISVLNENVCRDIKCNLRKAGIDKRIYYYNGETICGEG